MRRQHKKITKLQLQANRKNAAQSTGPRTEPGKQISALNNFRHGLASGQLIIAGEDPAGFEALHADYIREYSPATPTESALVLSMAQHYWLAQRAIKCQNGTFLGFIIATQTLETLTRYQTANQRAWNRCMNQLFRLRQHKEKAAVGFESQKHTEPFQLVKIKGLEAKVKLTEARTEAVKQTSGLRSIAAIHKVTKTGAGNPIMPPASPKIPDPESLKQETREATLASAA